MARKKKTVVEGEAPAPKPGGNGYDRDKVTGFVERLENLNADKQHIMMDALRDCKSVHEDIKLVYQEAKDEAGIPKKALKNVIKARALEAKAAAVREDLENEDQDNYDLIRQALGDLADTPLGGAVLANTPHIDTADAPFHAPPDSDTPVQADTETQTTT